MEMPWKALKNGQFHGQWWFRSGFDWIWPCPILRQTHLDVFTHHVVCCNGVCSQLKLYSCTSYNSLRDSGIQLLAPELPAANDGLWISLWQRNKKKSNTKKTKKLSKTSLEHHQHDLKSQSLTRLAIVSTSKLRYLLLAAGEVDFPRIGQPSETDATGWSLKQQRILSRDHEKSMVRKSIFCVSKETKDSIFLKQKIKLCEEIWSNNSCRTATVIFWTSGLSLCYFPKFLQVRKLLPQARISCRTW